MNTAALFPATNETYEVAVDLNPSKSPKATSLSPFCPIKFTANEIFSEL